LIFLPVIATDQLSKGVTTMGFFGKILEKLGIKKDEAEAAPAPAASTIRPMTAPPAAKPTAEAVKPKPVASVQKNDFDPLSSLPTAKATVTAISEVDVVKKLEGLSAGSNLDWKVSIVDLLKLLDIDSSREARNELAAELGCPAELMSDSAKMNVWLHKEVLKQIAKNGGNIPANLLD
jgi:hypothetical protein